MKEAFKMKKVLLLLTAFMLTGCQNQQVEETKTYQDGTYNATVNGYGGDFNMTLTIKNGEILDIVYVRDGKTLECSIKPIQISKKEYKLIY